jgi:hypothetical protein
VILPVLLPITHRRCTAAVHLYDVIDTLRKGKLPLQAVVYGTAVCDAESCCRHCAFLVMYVDHLPVPAG